MFKVHNPRQWKTKFDLCFLSKLQLCLSFWWYCLLFILFLKFVIILLIVIGIFKVLFFVWTTVWYWFLRDSDQKLFIEHQFSCQNIISLNIIRENHILFVSWTQGKILENRRKSGNTLGKLICKTAMNPVKVTLLHGCFPRFLNCTDGTKSRKAPHMININPIFHIMKFKGLLKTCQASKIGLLRN